MMPASELLCCILLHVRPHSRESSFHPSILPSPDPIAACKSGLDVYNNFTLISSLYIPTQKDVILSGCVRNSPLTS